VAAEALECLGGNGFVEESPMPKLLRDSPLNSIWEGSGNIMALDVLRSLGREPGAFGAVLAEVEDLRGIDDRFDAALGDAASIVHGLADGDPDDAQYVARLLAERLALLLQASLVLRHSPPPVVEAFLATRLGSNGGRAFGTLPSGIDGDAIINRHRPQLTTR